MNPNTSSPSEPAASPAGASAGQPARVAVGPEGPPAPERVPPGLEGLAAAVADLAADQLGGLGDGLLAEQVLGMRRLLDQLEGDWLRRLALLDAHGAAGAERGTQALSTTGWLRAACRMGAVAAGQRVRAARALHRGPLAGTAAALADGEVSYQHAAVLADATADLPPRRVAEAEPVLVDAARRLEPSGLRRLAAHLRTIVDPEAAEERAAARLERRGLWLAATFDGMVAVDGLLDPEAGEAARAALAPLARPAGPDDGRSAAQRRADALGELARQALQAGQLPQEGGLRPQLAVTVDLASLLATHGVGGTGGWGTPLGAEAARRLACDATVTRAVVRRHPGQADAGHTTGHASPVSTSAAGSGGRGGTDDGGAGDGALAAALCAAATLLPPPLGAPVELIDLGRATRVVSPALRRALALRDGGCIASGCDRPPPWTDAHHRHHWLDGGATSLDNLVLLCRVHHRAVHEHGWQLGRDPTSGQATLTPPARHPHHARQHQRPPPAA